MLTDKETVKFLEDFGDVKTLRELQKVCIILNIGKKNVKQIFLFWNKQIRLFFYLFEMWYHPNDLIFLSHFFYNMNSAKDMYKLKVLILTFIVWLRWLFVFQETVKDAPLDKWANFRGPRPDEDKSMVTFEKMKEEANKVIKEKNDKLRQSDDWKKSKEMQEKWIDTIRRQQEAVMKRKWASFSCLIVICVKFISWKQL